ncbi:DegT/DnrJ/EryC1/StrS family aminotransferase, partial [Streptomyces galilaeus]|uniref:DegT/DnrJ/EryC1/StrS family aminotransferase n=1 Tax=Streptomyces galilaeus TaxID=33899 RepID=UPI0038F75FAC
QKQRLDQLKNFGFESETQISMCGMNAKLNELQAGFGLVALNKIDESIAKRKSIANYYDNAFSTTAGIKTLDNHSSLELNYSYYPILIDQAEF